MDYITGRALREIEPASKMYAETVKISKAAVNGEALPDEANTLSITAAMDVMVHWFCILFQNQFTPDDVYDNYPVDRLMHDIAIAILAVQAQTTEVLSEFPTNPTAKKSKV